MHYESIEDMQKRLNLYICDVTTNLKKCVVRKLQIKATMRYHYIAIRIAKSSTLSTANTDEEEATGIFIYD